MAKVLISPGKYVQGAGEMKKTGRICSELWKEGSDPNQQGGIQANRSNGGEKFCRKRMWICF